MHLPDLSTEAAFKANVVAGGPLPARSQEGRRWEFKEGRKPPKDLAMILASFANTVGGTLIVGVGESEVGGVTYADGIHDVPGADQLRQDVLNHCATNLKPTPISESFPLVVDGKAVVVFQVEPSIRIVAHQAGDRLKYPYRDSHGTKYMDAARVEVHIMDENRSKHLRFLRSFKAANGPVKVLFSQQAKLSADDARFAGRGSFNTPRELPDPVQVVSAEDDHFVVGLGPAVPRENPNDTQAIAVPYECVEVLCPRLGGGLTVYVKGGARLYDRGGHPAWVYVPLLGQVP